MNSKIIDGKAVSASVKKEIKEKIDKSNKPNPPSLHIYQVGNNPASNIYIRNKMRACEEVGIEATLTKLDESTTEEELLKQIKSHPLSAVFVQLPLPPHINEEKITSAISSSCDVDGFTANNVGTLMFKHPTKNALMPCTAKGVMDLLAAYNIDLAGKHCVIVNRSAIVGKPLSMMLLNKDATVTICHSKTANLKEICRQADILITAIGKPKFFTKEYIKPNAVVIDVGMNRDKNNKLCGDVDFDNVIETVSLITPVPGGVGPMTVAELLKNVVQVWES